MDLCLVRMFYVHFVSSSNEIISAKVIKVQISVDHTDTYRHNASSSHYTSFFVSATHSKLCFALTMIRKIKRRKCDVLVHFPWGVIYQTHLPMTLLYIYSSIRGIGMRLCWEWEDRSKKRHINTKEIPMRILFTSHYMHFYFYLTNSRSEKKLKISIR